jgi:hypothetical protein
MGLAGALYKLVHKLRLKPLVRSSASDSQESLEAELRAVHGQPELPRGKTTCNKW